MTAALAELLKEIDSPNSPPPLPLLILVLSAAHVAYKS